MTIMRTISLSMFCFFVFCSNSTLSELTNKSDLENMRLKGQIDGISQRVYEASKLNNTIKKRHLMLDPLENWDIELNKKGNITKKKCYDSANEIIFYYDYKYKKKNQLIKKSMYDAQDYTIEQVTYVYNNLGEVAAESIYRADKSLLVRYIHNYSKKGQLIRTDVHAPTANVYTSSSYSFSYNKEDFLIEQKTYNTHERLHQTDSYTYDKYGYIKKHCIKNHFDNFIFTSYSRHDNNGNLITYQAPAEKTPATSYTYIFDEQENWTARTHYKNGKVQDIVERNIKYAN
jgi:hypothetical protein